MEKSAAKAVRTAEEALWEMEMQYYDLCFLDVNLPGISGIEAIKIMKELSPATKVVIMTGNYFDKGTKQQIESLFFEFIEKPFSLSQIGEIVDRVATTLHEQ